MDEKMKHFWVKQTNEILKQRDGSYVGYIQERRGIILSGASSITGDEEETSYKLEARYVPDKKRLKFRLYCWKHPHWEEIAVNKDNSILYGMAHYIENITEENVENEVRKYFDEFKKHVENLE